MPLSSLTGSLFKSSKKNLKPTQTSAIGQLKQRLRVFSHSVEPHRRKRSVDSGMTARYRRTSEVGVWVLDSVHKDGNTGGTQRGDLPTPTYLPDDYVESVRKVPKVELKEKVVEVPKIVTVRRDVEVPRIIEKEEVSYVVKPQLIEELVEVPQIQRRFHYTRDVEVPEIKEVVRQVSVPVIQYENHYVDAPQFRTTQKIVRIPQITYRKKYVPGPISVQHIYLS